MHCGWGGREEVSLVISVTQGECGVSYLCITDDLLCVHSGSAYISGGVVNGRIARAAS